MTWKTSRSSCFPRPKVISFLLQFDLLGHSIKELLAAEQKRIAEESAAAIADRIKPLPSTDGLDDEQLKQLARELHAAIDKVIFASCIL